MRYLIDTNVFMDYIFEDHIPPDVFEIIINREHIVYVSSESIKEFIHLVKTKKIVLKKELSAIDVFCLIEDTFCFCVKYVAKEHLRTFFDLDLVEGHNDPSDRLIIAQAITEKIPIISSDKKFPKYRKQGLEFIPNY